MLRSLVLHVERSADPWWDRPDAVRAFAYALFDRVEPALAAALHPDERPPSAASQPAFRPFTATAVDLDAYIRVRLTALTEASSRALGAAAEQLPGGPPLHFGDSTAPVLRAVTHEAPLAEETGYGALRR